MGPHSWQMNGSPSPGWAHGALCTVEHGPGRESRAARFAELALVQNVRLARLAGLARWRCSEICRGSPLGPPFGALVWSWWFVVWFVLFNLCCFFLVEMNNLVGAKKTGSPRQPLGALAVCSTGKYNIPGELVFC